MTADDEQLALFAPISLEEMASIKLMNRTDVKYVTDIEHLHDFLRLATADYRIQEVEGKRVASYRTVYLDTPARDMYIMHQCGRRRRVKVRVRTYADSGVSFFEVKNKDNHGRTDKKRIPVEGSEKLDDSQAPTFLTKHSTFDLQQLGPTLESRFHRITLVNLRKTERLTIDTDISFHNLLTENTVDLKRTVIIELKRDGLTPSPARAMLATLHIHPSGFSKYCIGSALTDSSLKQNRFKRNIMRILKNERMGTNKRP